MKIQWVRINRSRGIGSAGSRIMASFERADERIEFKHQGEMMRKIVKIQRGLCFSMGILCFLYYFLCGFYGGFHISILWIWIAAGIGFLLAGAWGAAMLKSRWAKQCRKMFFLTTVVMAALFFIFEALVFSGMNSKGPEDLDYIIVLGAAVNGKKPSGALEKRITTAYEYLKENQRTKAVASGGQGAGEEISEAECIAGELIKRGISPERIYLEKCSTTTAENMRFSYEIIGSPEKKVGIVTSDFHVYRSLCTARKVGFSKAYGIAAPYSKILRVQYGVREFAAFMVDYYLGNVKFVTSFSLSFHKMFNLSSVKEITCLWSSGTHGNRKGYFLEKIDLTVLTVFQWYNLKWKNCSDSYNNQLAAVQHNAGWLLFSYLMAQSAPAKRA